MIKLDQVDHKGVMRVAQVMGKMHGGGVESMVLNYYRHIDYARIQFDFLVDEDSTLVPISEIESRGGRIIEVPPYQKIARYQSAMRRIFESGNYSIVHSHINSLSIFPLRAAKRAGVPIRIAHSHSTSGKGEFARNVIKRALRTQANRYPTHRFACSREAGTWLFGKHVQFDVINNAFELDSFCFDEVKRRSCRAELGLCADDIALGHIGRFVPQKNHVFLIDIFYEVQKVEPRTKLILVGEGRLRDEVKQRISDLRLETKVLFLGQRHDPDRLYQAFDAFVLPSLYEGFGMVALEAQVSGLPCIVSDRVPEEVGRTNRIKFLPLDASAKGWAASILESLYEERDRFLSIEEENDVSGFDIKRVTRSLEDLYISLVCSAM